MSLDPQNLREIPDLTRPVGQIVGDRRQGEPGGIGREPARRQVRERPFDQISVDLLLHRMITMLLLSLDQRVGIAGEDRVVAPGGIQFVLAAFGLLVELLTRRTISRPVTVWPFLLVKAV